MDKKTFKLLYVKPKGDVKALYRRLLKYGLPFWPVFVLAVGADLIYSGVDAVFAYLIKPLVDKGFVQSDMTFIRWVPAIAIGLYFLRSVASLVGSYCMGKVSRKVIMAFRCQIFDQFMRLPCSFYDKSSSGQLLSMIIYNAAQVAAACTDALTTLVQSSCLALGLIAVMLTISWKMTLFFFITAPLLALVVRASSQRLRRLNRQAQDTVGELTHIAEEAIEGYKVVRTFGGEAYEQQKFEQAARRNLSRELKIIVTKELSVSAGQMLGVIALSGMIYLGATSALGESLSAGGFTSVMVAMMALLKPMKDLASVNAVIQRGLAGVESIFELLDTATEKNTGTVKIDRVKGAISYKAVSFAYGTQPVLREIDFSVEPGEIVAFVGRSGSGKSTLVSLLPRFYDAQSGQITLDGISVLDFELSALRTQFALVSQQVTLFNDTLANNIAYGRLEGKVTRQEIEQAAEAAHAMEFIRDLPQGLDTYVGENGVLLSGGQRQRIAIARAILKDAPVLILDEATSALDTESERLIQAALESVMRHRTTLVIAHRLSTIEQANKIVVMEGGQIIEMGTHQALLARDGQYAKLHRMQFNPLQRTEASSTPPFIEWA